jgi:hypothetical protein
MERLYASVSILYATIGLFNVENVYLLGYKCNESVSISKKKKKIV